MVDRAEQDSEGLWVRCWAAPLLLALLALLPFLPALFSDGIFVYRDHLAHFLPKRWVLTQVLAGSASPLWNPLMAAGTPYLADPQSGLFYPPALLCFGLLPFRVAYLLYPALHVVLAGLGSYWLLRSLRLNRISALFGGLLYQWSGFAFSLIELANNLCSFAWIPLVLGCAWRAGEGSVSGRRWSILTGMALATCFLAGEPQIALFTSLLAASIVVARPLKLRGAWRRSLSNLLWVATIAAGLSAAQALPLLDWVAQTRRTVGVELEQLSRHSLHAGELLDLFSPGGFENAAGLKWQGAQGYLATIYMGWLPVFALFWLRRREWSRLWPWSLPLLAGLALGLGSHLPGYAFLHTHLGFGLFRYPCRFVFLVFPSIAILAASGFAALTERLQSRGEVSWWRALAPATLAGCSAVLIFKWPAVWPAALRSDLAQGLGRGALFAALAGAVVLLGLFKMLRYRVVVALLLLLTGADLLSYHHTGFDTVPFQALMEPPGTQALLRPGPAGLPPRVIHQPGAELREQFIHRDDATPLEAARRLARSLAPAVSMAYGVAEVSRDGVYPLKNYEPVHIYLHAGEHRALEQLLGLQLRTGFATAEGGVQVVARQLSNDPLPLRLVLPLAEPDDPEAIIALLRDARHQLERGMPVPESMQAAPWESEPEPCIEGARVELLEWNGHLLRAAVELNCPAILVHTTSLLPGWSGSLDGERTALFPALGVFQALWVPSGAHEVSFEYWPRGLTLGLVIGAATLLVALVRLRR